MRFTISAILGFGIILTIMFTGQACDSDELPEPAPPSFCDTVQATYLTTIKPIIDNSCAISGCHLPGGSGPGNFSFYVGMEGFLTDDLFEQRVFFESDPILKMPPANAVPEAMLTDEQMDLLECWVSMGYPEE